MAKAYILSIYSKVMDADKLAAYAKLAKPALEAGGGRFIIRGVPDIVKEHGLKQRTVVIEFESLAAAEAAFDSPQYGEALAVLDGAAVRDIRIMEGWSEE